jgi:hypothetical protein
VKWRYFLPLVVGLGAAIVVIGGVAGDVVLDSQAHVERLREENERLRETVEMCWQVQRDSARACSYALLRAGGPCEPPEVVEP